MEMTLNVKITGLENLVAVLEKFASTVPKISTAVNDSVPVVTTPEQAIPATQSAPVNSIQAPQPVVSQAIPAVPVSQPTQQPVAPVVPVAPTNVVQAPVVPTTVQTYTQEQLALAATALVDAGRLGELQALLAAFNIQALTQLPQEQYGNFATQLRALGAKI